MTRQIPGSVSLGAGGPGICTNHQGRGVLRWLCIFASFCSDPHTRRHVPRVGGSPASPVLIRGSPFYSRVLAGSADRVAEFRVARQEPRDHPVSGLLSVPVLVRDRSLFGS